MSDFYVDFKGLDEFQQELEDLEKHFPKEMKKLLRSIGSKAKVIVARKARQLVKRDKGRYHKSFKRGKVFRDPLTDEWTVRVYSTDPKAAIIENGHQIIGRKPGKENHGFQPGYKVFDKSGAEIDRQMHEIVSTQLDKLLKKL